MATTPIMTESELQWDWDSAPEQENNCGPSSVEKIANFFKDLKHYGIQRTRRLGTSRRGTGTNATEQKRMLDRRGVPSMVMALTPTQVHNYLKSARRPLVLWLNMGFIPDDIAGHNFQGTHAVAALANGVVRGETGIWVNEPNQRRGRPGYKKVRFYPDKYWTRAAAAMGRWCIVPTKEKVISTRNPLVAKWRVVTNVNQRSAPTTSSIDVGGFQVGDTFTSNKIEREGGRYPYKGSTHDEWLGFVRNGKQHWVAKAYCREVN